MSTTFESSMEMLLNEQKEIDESIEDLPDELANVGRALRISCDTNSLVLTAILTSGDIAGSGGRLAICELDDAQWVISLIFCCGVPVRCVDMDMNIKEH